jgi:sigma-B regulation protein RsbU (phosphoserine phosphatase)
VEAEAIQPDFSRAIAREQTLRAVLGLPTIQRLQDGFARLGGVTISLTAMDGTAITERSFPDEFHALAGRSAVGLAAFAARSAGLAVDIAARRESMWQDDAEIVVQPIELEGVRLAVLAIETRPRTPLSAERLAEIAALYQLDPAAVQAIYPHVRAWSEPDRINFHPRAALLADSLEMLYDLAARIQRQIEDLQTVHQLTNLLSGTRSLQEILDRTVRRVVEVMRVKACGIRLLNPETGELRIQAVCNLSDEYLQKGPVRLGDSTIDAEAFSGKSVHIEDAATDPRIRYRDSMKREGIVSGLCVPMIYRGQTVGLIRLYTDSRRIFTASEEQLVRSIGSQTAAAIVNSRLFDARTEAEHYQRQVRNAGEVQRRMLPASLPPHPEVEFGVVYRPTLELGGDFYDFLPHFEGSVGVCVADVVGKGLPAALMMASIRSAMRAHAYNIGDVNELVVAVNQHMCRDTKVSEFASLVYTVISPDGREIRYCNAGHPPPLLLRSDRFTELSTGGLVIGVEPSECYQAGRLKLRAGDIVTFVTDGVTEAMNFHDEAYGTDRLRKSIHRHRRLTAQQLADQILWDVRRFVGLVNQSDDITVVVAKVRARDGRED